MSFSKINQTFKNYLILKGMRQRDLAKLTGFTEAYISRIICGWVPPSNETIEYLCDKLKCHAEEIGFVYMDKYGRYFQREYVEANLAVLNENNNQ